MARHADGAWWFADAGDGRTHVRWSYRFALRGPGALAGHLVLPAIWRPYASAVLGACIAAVESGR
jgi:hypothetical protein